MARRVRSVEPGQPAGGGLAPASRGAVALAEKQVSRLSLYRRLLQELRCDAPATIYSHDLATLSGSTAAQVRRDLMTIGFVGSPARGYDVLQLIEAIGCQLDAPGGQRAALAGVGQLGRALLDYFHARRPSLQIVAAFDVDPEKVRRVIHGCRVWPLEDMERVVREQAITVGVITVPATAAESVASAMTQAGIRGLLNFAPTPLRRTGRAFVEEMDITTSMEKVAYFARALAAGAGGV